MIQVKKSQDRGLTHYAWLKSQHTFSFGKYVDEQSMGFSVLRVMNEDQIAPGAGFKKHQHDNMEIISYVLKGALEHEDSLGNKSVIYPGEVQRMSAGKGVYHSEYNYSQDQESHFLQIWILPEKLDIMPSYDQKSFSEKLAFNDLVLVVSKSGRDGSLTLNQDLEMFILKSFVSGNKTIKVLKNRHYWIQILRGEVNFNNYLLSAGDGVGITDIESITLEWIKETEFILFDML